MSLSLPLSLEEVNFFSKKQNTLEAGSKSNQSTLPVGAICRMHSDTTQNRKARCLTNVPFLLLFSISKMTVVGPRKCELWNVLGRDLPKEDLPKAEPFPRGQPVWEWWPCACDYVNSREGCTVTCTIQIIRPGAFLQQWDRALKGNLGFFVFSNSFSHLFIHLSDALLNACYVPCKIEN